MIREPDSSSHRFALLYSGGLDSAVLAAELLAAKYDLQPIYVRSGYHWEAAELAAATRFWADLKSRFGATRDVVVLAADSARRLPATHWARSGRLIPDKHSDDLAVDLPGRNEQMLRVSASWCQQNGFPRLGIGTLRSSPFADATPRFLAQLEDTLAASGAPTVRLEQPLGRRSKTEVLAGGEHLPLELTLSCLSPVGEQHCGRCNKCGERERVFPSRRGRSRSKTQPSAYGDARS